MSLHEISLHEISDETDRARKCTPTDPFRLLRNLRRHCTEVAAAQISIELSLIVMHFLANPRIRLARWVHTAHTRLAAWEAETSILSSQLDGCRQVHALDHS